MKGLENVHFFLLHQSVKSRCSSVQAEMKSGNRVPRHVSERKHQRVSVDKKNQIDVTFCILYFSSNSCSTCFGQPCAHHQELTTA